MTTHNVSTGAAHDCSERKWTEAFVRNHTLLPSVRSLSAWLDIPIIFFLFYRGVSYVLALV